MSAKQVTRMQLTCDGCGVVYGHIDAPVTATRAHAAANGWRHKAVTFERSNWAKQVDVCPACCESDERVSMAVTRAADALEARRV